MKFVETKLPGSFVIEQQKIGDERGYFSRVWCSNVFAEQGLKPEIAQVNTSYNPYKGTLRGLHYQVAPNEEAKLIHCTRGVIFDVIVDMRSDSPTYMDWFGIELKEDSGLMLYAPEGFAHGYQAITDNSAIIYPATEFYTPKSERGVRWDDPSVGIKWPLEPLYMSDKDKAWPLIKT
jgi:dTDP-4-dehydrorhamnose 3,5-epimerase